MYEKYVKELKNIEDLALSRKINDITKSGKYIYINSTKMLNLSSNDYLGIAEDKEIAKSFFSQNLYSLGSASSRLLTGSSKIYSDLESFIAEIFQKEASLLFNSGYHANVGIFSSIASKRDVIFSDKLNHASIIDGMKLSEAEFHRYKHLDYEHLETLLEKYRHKFENAVIVTESVFSMDGDCADLNRLVELKNKYNAILAVDEAHAFGVFGDKALGLSEYQDCTKDIDLLIATFGKSIGSVGAFCTGNSILINYLINKARSFIFSTSLPEINIAFSKYVLKNIIPYTKDKREELLKNAKDLKSRLLSNSLNTMGDSHIVPVIIGENNKTAQAAEYLQKEGYYLLPIRHPTVPEGTSRLRISLRADLDFEDIKNLPELIKITLKNQ